MFRIGAGLLGRAVPSADGRWQRGASQQLFEDGWAGVVAPSAARPKSLIACVFMTDWPPAGCKPIDATTVAAVPPRPRGMAT
jgi:hypothetical protein